jgi:hypothetical protein
MTEGALDTSAAFCRARPARGPEGVLIFRWGSPRRGDADVDYQARLLGSAKVEVVALAQTGASLSSDDFDDRITRRMSKAAGVPAIASARAIGLAVRALGARRVARWHTASDRGHLFQEPPEAGKFLIGPHYLNHRQERGLVCYNDRLANRAFRSDINGIVWKIAAGNNEDLNLRPICPRNGIACQFLSERRI